MSCNSGYPFLATHGLQSPENSISCGRRRRWCSSSGDRRQDVDGGMEKFPSGTVSNRKFPEAGVAATRSDQVGDVARGVGAMAIKGYDKVQLCCVDVQTKELSSGNP